MMHFTSVLLPAPFSPSSACSVPGRTFSSTLSSATKSPKRIVIAMASTPKAPVGAGYSPIFTRTPFPKCATSERSDQVARRRHRAEHAALHLDHLQRGIMVALVGGAAAVLDQHAFKAAVVGLAHGGVNADVGGDAGQHDVFDAAHPQQQFEIGGAERA